MSMLLLIALATPHETAIEARKSAGTTTVVPVRLAARPGPTLRALRYPLLPDDLEIEAGNAAPLWIRAGTVAREKGTLSEEQLGWLDGKTRLADLPRGEVRKLLDRYAVALSLAESAARRARCDWELPPLTIRSVQELPLHEISDFRLLARLLSLKARLQLADGKIDNCLRTVQTGLALSRHVAAGEMIIQGLVALAIGEMMLQRLEECLSQPAMPNLYWSLTTLPTSFVDLLPAVRAELGTVHRSIPQLRLLEQATLPRVEVEAIQRELLRQLDQIGSDQKLPAWLKGLGFGAFVAWNFETAKKALLDAGWEAERLAAMLPQQVVALHMVSRHNHYRDEILKSWPLPAPIAWRQLDRVETEMKKAGEDSPGDVLHLLSTLLLPAVARSHVAQVRLDRHLAALRVVEAIRLHAAAHEGKPPEKLSAITVVPLPLDPATQRPFDDCYQRTERGAVLDVKPIGGKISVGWRYEFTAEKK